MFPPTPRSLTDAVAQRRNGEAMAFAAVAIALPFLFAPSFTPTTTFVNQWLAFCGLSLVLLLWVAGLEQDGTGAALPRATPAMRMLLLLLLVLAAGQALGGLSGRAPWGQRLVPVGCLLLAAALAWAAGLAARAGRLDAWWSGVLIGLLFAGGLSVLISLVQVFAPWKADGLWVAASTTAGRAIGNMRQPNQLSTLLLWAGGAAVAASLRWGWRWPLLAAALGTLVLAEVLNASRTGMVGVLLLALWGAFDRRLPRATRWVMVVMLLVYGLGWWSMETWAARTGQDFFGDDQVRKTLHGDPSSSRGKIWSNTLALIATHPWTGVGPGAFNFIWSMTPFPDRPVAFFDHTHNLPLELAVQLGLPYLLLVLVIAGLLLRRLGPALRQLDDRRAQAARCAAFLLVLALVHSLLEYPLWYVYFLLPAALVAGTLAGLAGPVEAAGVPSGAGADRATSPADAQRVRGASWLLTAALLGLAGSAWAAREYYTVAVIFDPGLAIGTPGSLSQRIARGQRSVLFGHHADYAAVTMANHPEQVYGAFERPLYHLLDTRLMSAWARALEARGDTERAAHVAARLREFRNPAAAGFFAPCAELPAGVAGTPQAPFPCGPDPALPAEALRP